MPKKRWRGLTTVLDSPIVGFWRYSVQIGMFAGSKDHLIAITKKKHLMNPKTGKHEWMPVRNFFINLKFAKWLFGTGGAIERVKKEYDCEE